MLRFATACIRLYQLCLSPYLAPTCRFDPTCSEYSLTALRRHGISRGLRLSLKRLLRCHPFGGMGYDPVDERRHHGG